MANQLPDHVDLDDPDGPQFTGVSEAAVVLDANPRTIRVAIQRGQIPAVRVGWEYKIPMSWLRRAAAGEFTIAGPGTEPVSSPSPVSSPAPATFSGLRRGD